MSRKDQQRRWFYSQCLAAKLVARSSTLRCWSERRHWAESDTCVICGRGQAVIPMGCVFCLQTSQMRKINCEWIWVIVDDYGISLTMVLNLLCHVIPWIWVWIMLHFSGITQVASDQARVRKILISDLYAKVKAKGSSRCQKQWEFFSTILAPFSGACLKRGLCMVCVIFYWVVVSCLHKKSLGSRHSCCENWSKDRKKIWRNTHGKSKMRGCLVINANNSSTAAFIFSREDPLVILYSPLFPSGVSIPKIRTEAQIPKLTEKNTRIMQWVK